MEKEEILEPPKQKKSRHRKKQLYSSILKQMEFYFCDANLTKDRFLSQQLTEKKYVPLEVFLTFNKLAKITSKIEDIRKAVKNSALIELNEDESAIGRKIPFKRKENAEESTIYVEKLKSDATHEWLTSIFAEFGQVVYVSIPKFHLKNTIKGFAFVEFEKEQDAKDALKFFGEIGLKMPGNIEPGALCSINTFDATSENSDKNVVKVVEEFVERNGENLKRKNDDENGNDEKKMKLTIVEEVEDDKETLEEIKVEDDSKKKKKMKKEQKKRTFFKELGLQVLSKNEWKRMRNRYLDLQRKKMREFKKHLHRARFSSANYDEKKVKKDPKSTKTNSDLEINTTKPENIEIKQPKLEYIEGVIVKIRLQEPCADPKKIKTEIKAASGDVKYVDVPNPGCDEIFLRFGDNSAAKTYADQTENVGEKCVIKNEEEASYWRKLGEMREEKFKKSNRKQRGRDKLLKKANKVKALHIKFDE